jgi:hypothetical protein
MQSTLYYAAVRPSSIGIRCCILVLSILIGACISASPPRSLAGPATPVGTILAVRWLNKDWSPTRAARGAELAASEQAQLEAARARLEAHRPSHDLAAQYEHPPQLPAFRRAAGFRRSLRAASSVTAWRGLRRAAASASRRAGSTARGGSLRSVARLPVCSRLGRAR